MLRQVCQEGPAAAAPRHGLQLPEMEIVARTLLLHDEQACFDKFVSSAGPACSPQRLYDLGVLVMFAELDVACTA